MVRDAMSRVCDKNTTALPAGREAAANIGIMAGLLALEVRLSQLTAAVNKVAEMIDATSGPYR